MHVAGDDSRLGAVDGSRLGLADGKLRVARGLGGREARYDRRYVAAHRRQEAFGIDTHPQRHRGQRHEDRPFARRSEEHTSELQSLMRISYAVFCLKKKKKEQLHTASEDKIRTNR